MRFRRYIPLTMLLLATLAAGYWGWSWWSRPSLNILLITLDTTRADRIGCYGYAQAETPTIDRLAEQGVVFERCFSPAPLTLPSHASLLTGMLPPEHGLRTNGRGALAETIPTLPVALKNAGYQSAAFVSSFVLDARFGLDRGFDLYDDDWTSDPDEDRLHQQRDGRQTVQQALGWLSQLKTGPFFCWVHLYDPHTPYLTHTDDFGDRFADRPYDAEIAYTDRLISQLLDQIQQQGQADKTIVVVVGDHGEGFGDQVERTHGYTIYNVTQQVPLIVSLPGQKHHKRRISGAFPLSDLAPTLLDAVGVSAQLGENSLSAFAALAGGELSHRLCYAATDDPFLQNDWSPLQCLIDGDWKYIQTTQPELYHLADDFDERHNLIDSEPAQRAAMERKLKEFTDSLQAGESNRVQLSTAEINALRGLGYVGSGTKDTPVNQVGDAPLPDVKEMLPLDNRTDDALALLNAGKYTEAEQILRDNLRQSRRHLSSYVYLGELLEQQGQSREAMELYEQALAIKPDHVDALIHLGALQATTGQFSQALPLFKEALRIDPAAESARYNLAHALAQMGQLPEAIQQFEKLLSDNPRFANAHGALASAWLAMGNPSKAIQEFEAEVEVNPAAVSARLNLATLWAESRPSDAERLLQEAGEQSPDDPMVAYNRGAFYLLHSRPADAIPYLERAVKLQPDHPRAASELARAKRMLDASPGNEKTPAR